MSAPATVSAPVPSITVTVRLMSGDVLQFDAPTRDGSLKYITVRKQLCDMVLNALLLDPKLFVVSLIHDDDEDRMKAIWQGRVAQDIRVHGPNVHTAKEKYEDLQWFQKISLNAALQQVGTYTNGSIVHALVQEK